MVLSGAVGNNNIYPREAPRFKENNSKSFHSAARMK
jgi:hypothetical protein